MFKTIKKQTIDIVSIRCNIHNNIVDQCPIFIEKRYLAYSDISIRF